MQPVPRSFQAHRPVLDEAWPAQPPGSPRYDPKQNFRLPLELEILTNRRCAHVDLSAFHCLSFFCWVGYWVRSSLPPTSTYLASTMTAAPTDGTEPLLTQVCNPPRLIKTSPGFRCTISPLSRSQSHSPDNWIQ